mmetsp:Transcript_37310/g.76022  ORF Transcript_37310/g.76022 Transcript_37310/m.76022 type:complete len:143 (-) Transcript_37310:97-525(-)
MPTFKIQAWNPKITLKPHGLLVQPQFYAGNSQHEMHWTETMTQALHRQKSVKAVVQDPKSLTAAHQSSVALESLATHAHPPPEPGRPRPESTSGNKPSEPVGGDVPSRGVGLDVGCIDMGDPVGIRVGNLSLASGEHLHKSS